MKGERKRNLVIFEWWKEWVEYQNGQSGNRTGEKHKVSIH
jgi:hypothetical protein